MHKICKLLNDSTKRDELLSIVHTIVLDSVELDKSKSLDETDDPFGEDETDPGPKTEEEILDALERNTNDALVIMAEPIYGILYELCLIYYDELRTNGEIEVNV